MLVTFSLNPLTHLTSCPSPDLSFSRSQPPTSSHHPASCPPTGSFVPSAPLQYLDAALLELDCLVQRHSDVAVLEACARAYGTYCDEGRSAHGQAAPACSRLVDMLVDALTPLLDVFIQHEKQGLFLGHGEMGRICSTLRRLAAFYR